MCVSILIHRCKETSNVKNPEKKPMRFESIYTTLNGNTDQIACKYDTQNWTLFHPIARDFQGKSILIV